VALSTRKDLDKVVACFRRAIDLDPEYGEAYNRLGLVLSDRNDPDGAMLHYREAIRADPTAVAGHFGLGNALSDKGDADGAIASYREALRLDPTVPEVNCNLGLGLLRRGRPAEALPLLKRGHELGRRQPGWRYPSAQWVAECERAVRAQERIAPPPRAK
jgi:tetratricopeptide (TPR) repeat protein